MSDIRFCPSCGTQVSPNERFCGNCGTRMDQPAATPASPTVPLGQASSGPTQVLPPAPTPSSQPELPPFGAPPPGAPVSFGAPPDATPPTPPRRGLPMWAIILLSVVGLCAVGCVASVALVAIFGNSSTAEATATPQPSGLGGGIVPVPTREGDTPTEEIPAPTEAAIPTRPAAPTEAAAPTSGGGGIVDVGGGGASAARTAEAATAQVISATAEVDQANAEVASIVATGKQIFSDEFVDNHNAWFTGVFEQIETDTIEDGVFKVAWTAKGTSYELYEVRELTNFAAEVDCLIHQGGRDGSCGIVFGQKTNVGFYKFELFDDYYRLFVVHPQGDPTMLVEGDPAGIVKPGDVNRLRVIKRGDEIRLFLNGVPLKTVSDSTYQTGKVGVSTNSYNESGGVEIWFDNFVIWELPT